MEQLNQCPVCSSNKLKSEIRVTDHFGTKEEFQLQRCSDCQVMITNPRPNSDGIKKYYQSNTYVSHGQSKGFLFDLIYQTIQSINLKRKLRLVKKYSLSKRLLDYGCGAGSFLQFMNKKGYDVMGVEPNGSAREIIPSHLSVHSDLQYISDHNFDIITLFHVLEHVHDLESIFNRLKNLLTPNGVLILALPNYESEDAKHYQSLWAGYDVPRHLYHFNQSAVFQLAKKHQLNILATHPMHFDSYYASLLSEQYKKSKFAAIRALWHGYRSNKKAQKTGEFSSLIYILTN